MTWANRITLFRLFLIPFFVGSLLYYQQSIHRNVINENYRRIALVIFIVAAISDGIDGYLARHFNQRSRLGAILDPIADKLLMLSALITLGFISGPGLPEFPLWFPMVVIGRDVILLLGTLLLHYLAVEVKVEPHWTGKVSTFFVFVAISSDLLQLACTHFLCYVGGFFTLICTVIYIRNGLIQFKNSGHTDPSGH